jgi:hypothetical protein
VSRLIRYFFHRVNKSVHGLEFTNGRWNFILWIRVNVSSSVSSNFLQFSAAVFQIFRPLLERFGGTFDYRIISRLVNAIYHKENRRIRKAVYCRHLKNKKHYIWLFILRQSTVNLPCSGCEGVCGSGGVTPFIHKLHQMEVNGYLHMLDA